MTAGGPVIPLPALAEPGTGSGPAQQHALLAASGGTPGVKGFEFAHLSQSGHAPAPALSLALSMLGQSFRSHQPAGSSSSSAAAAVVPPGGSSGLQGTAMAVARWSHLQGTAGGTAGSDGKRPHRARSPGLHAHGGPPGPAPAHVAAGPLPAMQAALHLLDSFLAGTQVRPIGGPAEHRTLHSWPTWVTPPIGCNAPTSLAACRCRMPQCGTRGRPLSAPSAA